jgi:hypothetical protein
MSRDHITDPPEDQAWSLRGIQTELTRLNSLLSLYLVYAASAAIDGASMGVGDPVKVLEQMRKNAETLRDGVKAATR